MDVTVRSYLIQHNGYVGSKYQMKIFCDSEVEQIPTYFALSMRHGTRIISDVVCQLCSRCGGYDPSISVAIPFLHSQLAGPGRGRRVNDLSSAAITSGSQRDVPNHVAGIW